jgi:hypothetical protein
MKQNFLVWPRLATTILFSTSTFSSALHAMDYPELLVTPLASERITMEAAGEKNARQVWLDHAAVMTPGVLTMIAAASLYSQRDDLDPHRRSEAKDAAMIGFTIGAFWTGYSAYLATTYSPYQAAARELNQLQSDTLKKKLVKERIAEERISEAATFGRNLSWLSAGTLLVSSLAISSNGRDETQAVAVVAAVSSLAPIFLNYRWQKVSRYHEDYKKRIYGPLISSSVYGRDGRIAPMLMVSSSF